jgi:hypothetical protein
MNDKVIIPKVYKNWPIVIDEQGFRRLYDEIKKILGKESDLIIKIRFSDKSLIETRDLDTLLNDENRRGRRIRIIEFLGSSVVDEKTIHVSFGSLKIVKNSEQYQPHVSLEIIGPDRQWVFVTQSEIEDRIETFMESRLTAPIIAFILMGLVLVIELLILKFFRTHLGSLYKFDPVAHQEMLSGIPIVLMAITIIAPGIATFLLYKDITFIIGGEAERHQTRLKRRSNIFWSVIISFVVGLILLFLPKLWGG